jgi:hypothetical protein
VRELPAAVVVSLAVHAIAIGTLRDVRVSAATAGDTTPAPAPAEPAPAVVEWVDVELVPPPVLARATSPPRARFAP